jgi:cobalt-zinc-cadmium efflux system outer membrane protein
MSAAKTRCGDCRRAVVTALCLTVLAASAGRADELAHLVSLAFRYSPVLQAARAGVGQADAAREAADEFLDPATLAAGGRTTGSTAPPLLGDPAGLPLADAYGASARVEVPLQPGVYAGAGVSEQYLLNPPTTDDHLYRTVAGAQLRIPLLQDRGFNLWKQDRARLSGLREAALARLLEAFQTVRHAVEQAYIDYLEALANAATSASATDRALHLLQEAEELVRLKVVPEYQLAPARLEVALRREEARTADQAIDTARLRLVQVLGGAAPGPLSTNTAVLIDLAAGARLPAVPVAERAFASRGAARELESLARAAAATTRALDDRLRPDLSLTVRGVWQAEDASAPPGDGVLAEGADEASAAAVLVWTRPWHQTGPRARRREARAREQELAELHREVVERLAADLAAAHREFTGARQRFEEITTAVEQARRSLEAEAERFRLGDGRSRNVLDAQNDLTKTHRTRNAIMAALLRGHSDYLYAAGYNPDDSRAAGAPPLGDDHGGHQ